MKRAVKDIPFSSSNAWVIYACVCLPENSCCLISSRNPSISILGRGIEVEQRGRQRRGQQVNRHLELDEAIYLIVKRLETD